MCRRASPPLVPQPQEPVIQIQKPFLTRKLIGSAKINLNKYWNVFEAMVDSNSANIENENIDNERRLASINLRDRDVPNYNIACNTHASTSQYTNNSS